MPARIHARSQSGGKNFAAIDPFTEASAHLRDGRFWGEPSMELIGARRGILAALLPPARPRPWRVDMVAAAARGAPQSGVKRQFYELWLFR